MSFVKDTDTLQVEYTPIQLAGQAIEKDSTHLAGELKTMWEDFQSEYTGQAYGCSTLPGCLQIAFYNYDTTHKPQLDTIISNRQNIGKILEGSADLFDFHDKIVSKSFNIYTDQYENGSKDGDRPLDNLQIPNDFQIQ
ncbi:hypothetical protein [Tengunoibacter tsumagoiensis]|uniref:Uncharacterized protein n=1 Tax=Tengunoibacter tsumagoiensis TaxID=2014871 RepID=A0A401ZWP9_9CHLR|nr:hypothetical protein [Tengunoibacter tsumagoiensis]GCE11287.1 hypothetical protein KTT_11460 [Tengunoibacter tsumagoiensis]